MSSPLKSAVFISIAGQYHLTFGRSCRDPEGGYAKSKQENSVYAGDQLSGRDHKPGFKNTPLLSLVAQHKLKPDGPPASALDFELDASPSSEGTPASAVLTAGAEHTFQSGLTLTGLAMVGLTANDPAIAVSVSLTYKGNLNKQPNEHSRELSFSKLQRLQRVRAWDDLAVSDRDRVTVKTADRNGGGIMLRKVIVPIALLALCGAALAQPKAGTPMVVLLLGPPGAGKTTQAKRVSGKYHIPSISLSDLLKQDAGWGKAGSKKVLKAQMESGELVNDETADLLVRKRLFLKDAGRGFILDGYPSNAAQADKLAALLKERYLPQPVVIYLDVPDDVVRQRMKHRHQADDTPEMIEHRLAEYHRNAQFLLERYPAPQLKKIDGSKSEDQVWKDVEAALR